MHGVQVAEQFAGLAWGAVDDHFAPDGRWSVDATVRGRLKVRRSGAGIRFGGQHFEAGYPTLPKHLADDAGEGWSMRAVPVDHLAFR